MQERARRTSASPPAALAPNMKGGPSGRPHDLSPASTRPGVRPRLSGPVLASATLAAALTTTATMLAAATVAVIAAVAAAALAG